jgi:anti-anti-sigma factor
MVSGAQPIDAPAVDRDFASLVISASCGGSRLRIAGELDAQTTPILVDAVLAAPGDGDLTLDVSRLMFIDAAGLGGLIVIRRELAALDRGVRIVGASARIARTCAVGGVGAFLTPAPDPAILDQLTTAVMHAAAQLHALPSQHEPELQP